MLIFVIDKYIEWGQNYVQTCADAPQILTFSSSSLFDSFLRTETSPSGSKMISQIFSPSISENAKSNLSKNVEHHLYLNCNNR